MTKQFKKTLFIFRRDLRREDNTGLQEALRLSEVVIPCFIATPEQLSSQNRYRSSSAIGFMLHSLDELARDLAAQGGRLYFFHGHPHEIVEQLITTEHLSAVMVNRDYTPYSRARDEKLQTLCEKMGVIFKAHADILLREPEDGISESGKFYQIFTPFYKKNSTFSVATPHTSKLTLYATHALTLEKKREYIDSIIPVNSKSSAPGGRAAALKILKSISDFNSYGAHHNDLTYGTTHLSPHNKFGTVSIRELFHTLENAFGPKHDITRQLYWRDFFYHVAWFNPSVLGHPFRAQYETLSWNEKEADFKRWCEGTTGFPVVDAGMRELNETGFMHNRARLIVGSFLVKDLHINWQWGERYFAQQLTDYDPCVNNGNWQWVASTGCDAQPYFRIFNPWLQQKRFDPTGKYIRRWIPELKHTDSTVLHTLYKQKSIPRGYHAPMVDHGAEVKKTKIIYGRR